MYRGKCSYFYKDQRELSHKIISIDPLTGVPAIKTKVIFDMLVSVLQF